MDDHHLPLLLLLFLLSSLCVSFLQEQDVTSSFGSPGEKARQWVGWEGLSWDMGPLMSPSAEIRGDDKLL